MQLIYLIIGTFLTVLFLLKLSRGKKFEYLTENLTGNDYPLSSVYGVGFSWSETKFFSLKNKRKEKLIGQAKLLYDSKYAEYYANLTWAQSLTFVHMFLAIGFSLAGLLDSGFMAFFGIIMAVVSGYYFLNHMNDMLKTRESRCTEELPEIVSTMALLINAGMMLRKAWKTIAESKEGEVYDLMLQSCNDMENGMSMSVVSTPSPT